MLCPVCRSAVCRRSRRRGSRDKVAAWLGFRPWRCQTCQTRFFGHAVAVKDVPLVHCPQCGNLDVQRVTRDRVVQGMLPGLKRLLRFPAFRCDACRHRFFSLRLYRPVMATHYPEFGDKAVAGAAPPPAAVEAEPAGDS